MTTTTSSEVPSFLEWTWADIEPQYSELVDRDLDEGSVDQFLLDWSTLSERVDEIGNRLHVGTTRNTADEEIGARYHAFLDQIYPNTQQAEQRLKEKLLNSGLEPEGFGVPLRKMRSEAELFRAENLPLLAEEQKLAEEYFKITGAQTVEWEGKQLPTAQVRILLQEHDRVVRERVWRLIAARQLEDREKLNDLWKKLLTLRLRIAANAGFSDYRSYAWKSLQRFDYSPEDARSFHRAVEEVVVPAVRRAYERRRQQLGLDNLQPWDLEVDPLGRPPLRPFQTAEELAGKSAAMFRQVDPKLGEYFDTLIREDLLDLESRANKAPGGYCASFSAARKPFIFSNVAGTRADVEVVLHEGGHAFHTFESAQQPYSQQRNGNIGMEFAEVASMAMEFLAAPYLSSDRGGFYTPEDAARARAEHLQQRVLILWARLMVSDAFQHWIYENPEAAMDPAQCDASWADLTRRFVPVVDYSGLDAELDTGWHNILHIHVAPFYMIEYALAELGAVQIWANARENQADAVARYRAALSLGDTRPIPELFEAAGARFAFDAATLRSAVNLVESTIAELEGS